MFIRNNVAQFDAEDRMNLYIENMSAERKNCGFRVPTRFTTELIY